MKDGCDAVRFVIRRILRLLPAMLLLVAAACLLNALCGGVSLSSQCDAWGYRCAWPHFLRHCLGAVLGYGVLFLSPPIPYATVVTWSLNVEDQFYAAIALCAACSATCCEAGRTASKPVSSGSRPCSWRR